MYADDDLICIGNIQTKRKQALQSKVEAEKEGIVVPLTLEEYCLKPKINTNNQEPQVSRKLQEEKTYTHSSLMSSLRTSSLNMTFALIFLFFSSLI